MTTTERRRNMRAENCRACGEPCEAGKGYLYRDTRGKVVRRLGRFGWFVKCESCHQGAKTRESVFREQQAAKRANEPIIRPWAVPQVKKWTISRIAHLGDVAICIEAGMFTQIVSYRDPMNGRFTAPTGYAMEQMIVADKPLSEQAARFLSGRILALVKVVQAEEQASGERAVAKLVAAGATVDPAPSGHGWRVALNGGNYSLWGFTGGKNKIMGVPGQQGGWVETTIEKLLGTSEG